MDLNSIACDPTTLELALMWVHLPSGAAAIQGVVRHPDGGPVVGGSKVRARPVGAGGIEVLFAGADPVCHRLSPRQVEWARKDPEFAQAAAEGRGWNVLTRFDAAYVMIGQGYRLRDSCQPGHVLHTDLADPVVWHPRIGIDDSGRPSPFMQAAFVMRQIEPGTPVPEVAHRA